MTIVTVQEAKTNLLRLIKKAALGEGVIIAVARLVPIAEIAGRRRPGSLKGKLRVTADFFKPLPHTR